MTARVCEDDGSAHTGGTAHAPDAGCAYTDFVQTDVQTVSELRCIRVTPVMVLHAWEARPSPPPFPRARTCYPCAPLTFPAASHQPADAAN